MLYAEWRCAGYKSRTEHVDTQVQVQEWDKKHKTQKMHEKFIPDRRDRTIRTRLRKSTNIQHNMYIYIDLSDAFRRRRRRRNII